MFTGIVTDLGEIQSVEKIPAGLKTRIGTTYDPDTIDIGASIACGGPCHTVVAKGKGDNRNWFEVESGAETLALTTVGRWAPGMKINLERSLSMGAELGGHLVLGHVDGLATITKREDHPDSVYFQFEAPAELARFIAKKGSVALDGTSLTVNEADGNLFSVFLIPHTLDVTTWSERNVGDKVNLEVDMMARYAARLAEFAKQA
ncbi:riboflavin synthase alpha chain [Roseibium hamelinense]|uniref:Riboflavin synthase n=1 Tax=Roseibium hamelinense TaxID=150831 RepID=A0A562TH99_9HYPH|nr:riboflavin synthase [Roseibium hamelinense]MTI46194.1 riboflavin synthase [Roseibium hamelinense]TWI92614.1 riboflavin synthase alpha chain [Roseibium hamelinense]